MENTRPWIRHYDYNVPTTIRYPRWSTMDLIQAAANKNPDQTAVNFLGAEMSFWELRTRILKMANALGGLGITKGDRVGLHLPTSPQYIIAFFAVTGIGGIVVNLNPMYTVEELKFLAQDTGMSALITHDDVLANVRELADLIDIKHIIVSGVADFSAGGEKTSAKSLDLEEGWHHFSELMDNCTNTRLPRVTVGFDDPAVLQFTGGTTGVPKGAILHHRNVIAATFQCALWGNATIRDFPVPRRSVLGTLPFFHVYGLIVVMCSAIFNSATQILVPRFDLEELIVLLKRHKEITFFPSVPTIINALIHHPQAEQLELGKKFGVLNSGAAPIARETIEQIKDAGIYFSEGWGMSETTGLGISNPQLGMKKVGSIGVPFPDTDVRLVDVDNGDEVVKKGEPGEIMIKSPLLMSGYWNKPDETQKELTQDGWLHTGDVAIQDEDDYFFIVDRKKDLIIAGGYNIYPREVDEVLYQHPKILDAVTIGVPDDYRGENIKSYVVVRPGETVDAEDIIDFSRTKLAAYKVPRIIEFRETLPKSAVGKILRKELRKEEAEKKNS